MTFGSVLSELKVLLKPVPTALYNLDEDEIPEIGNVVLKKQTCKDVLNSDHVQFGYCLINPYRILSIWPCGKYCCHCWPYRAGKSTIDLLHAFL